MRFLLDRCAGRRLAEWLQGEGHDVLEARTLGADPGDRALLELAASENRVLITIDTDFGELVYLHDLPTLAWCACPTYRRNDVLR